MGREYRAFLNVLLQPVWGVHSRACKNSSKHKGRQWTDGHTNQPAEAGSVQPSVKQDNVPWKTPAKIVRIKRFYENSGLERGSTWHTHTHTQMSTQHNGDKTHYFYWSGYSFCSFKWNTPTSTLSGMARAHLQKTLLLSSKTHTTQQHTN